MNDQLAMPFYCDEEAAGRFLTQWYAIEQEEARLREEKRLLKAQFQDDFPMRAFLTAFKVVRARRLLDAHPKDPMPLAHQGHIEAMVERHLDTLEREGRFEEAPAVPDMTR